MAKSLGVGSSNLAEIFSSLAYGINNISRTTTEEAADGLQLRGRSDLGEIDGALDGVADFADQSNR